MKRFHEKIEIGHYLPSNISQFNEYGQKKLQISVVGSTKRNNQPKIRKKTSFTSILQQFQNMPQFSVHPSQKQTGYQIGY